MESTLLISINDINHYTTISGDIDPNKMNAHILNAQILYIEPCLGSNLYDKLIDLVYTNAITATTYSDYNTLLLNYVTPALVFNTMEFFISMNSFTLGDGGTFQYTPSNATFSPLDEIEKITNKYRIIGSKYTKKMSEYLCKYSTLFPEYTQNDGLIKKTEPTMRSGGWYLGNVNDPSKIRM